MSPRAIALAQAAIERVLRLDPEAQQILEPLDGKRIEIQVTGVLAVHILVTVAAQRFELAEIKQPSSEAIDADVSIRGSLAALAGLLRSGDALPSTAQVRVQGDLAVLSQVRGVFSRLRPDFEEPLAQLLGDEAAYPISQMARKLAATARRSFFELSDDLAEFLGEESGLLVTHDDVLRFGDEVDRLRDSMERMDKRVSAIEASTRENEN